MLGPFSVLCGVSSLFSSPCRPSLRVSCGTDPSQKQIRMFFRLQRLSVYFAKLLESKAHPLWGLDDPIDPRAFAREVTKNN